MNITEESELIESFFQEAAKRKMANYGQEEILDFRILQSKYTTDEIFELLPSFVYHNGYYYHFNLIKGKRGVVKVFNI